MRFVSTRGGDQATFEEAIGRGYARDGGLYLPEDLEAIPLETIALWKSLAFPALCEELFVRWIGDEVPREQLRRVFDQCFVDFSEESIIPVRKVGEGCYVAELFHGPTFSFKDFGQQMLCKLLDHFAQKRERVVTLLVSTTGDTGPAAIRACASLPSLRIVCCYPLGQLSRFQEMQMTTVEGTNVNVFAFEGGGDDMDAPIKALSTDAAFQEKYHVASVNSINLARILAQTVHFFFSYFRAIEHAGLEVGAKVCLAVPCGALGNIVAALIAKRLGLPLGVIVCGTNANDIFHRAVADGDFTRHPTMHRTLSEAINIQVPYNFERVIALLADDAPLIKSMMEELTRDNKMAIPPALLASLRDTFRTTPVDDDALLAEIRARWGSRGKEGYLVDLHTGVSLHIWAILRVKFAILAST
mmetsp:Transcript_26637/g.61684  ORF Transcript_26637/g.61684 Transcript_26637/m.61684 type:complete len:415 (-) Transcript_26637:41-1285(-)